MQLTIEQPTLATALTRVARIIEKKNTLPIIGNVLLQADENGLTIRATDLDIEATTIVPCDVSQPGETTVGAELLSNIVRKMAKGKPVALAMKKDRLHVSSGKTNVDFATLPASDFPPIASEEYACKFSMPADDLARVFRKSSFAMSTDETRYFLNGVYLHNTEQGITGVATDGHQFAKVWTGQNVPDMPGVIVPRKTVSEVAKLLDIGDIDVSMSETKLRFDMGDTVIVSKVIDGTFPDYTKILPVIGGDTFRTDAKALASSAALVSMVAEDKVRGVKLSVGTDAVNLCVSGQHNAEDDVDATVMGSPVSIGFNAKYLANVLAQAEGGDVDVYYKGDASPALVVPTEDDKFLAVVMPMRM